jgi:hypothetical protein
MSPAAYRDITITTRSSRSLTFTQPVQGSSLLSSMLTSGHCCTFALDYDWTDFSYERCWMGLRASKSGQICVRKWKPLRQHFLASKDLRSVLSLRLLHNHLIQYQTILWFYFILDLSNTQLLFSPCFHLCTALPLHASPVPCYYHAISHH